MKEIICTIAGVVGGFVATLLGGWDAALSTLIVFMGVDFVTGLVTAAIGKSKHSKSGKLNSKAGWIGLAKKFCILLMVVVAVRIDILLGTTYIRDTVCISFCLNELLSIVENTNAKSICYEVKVAKNDMGKVIGKQGKMAKAIRSIMKAVAVKEHKKINVEFLD